MAELNREQDGRRLLSGGRLLALTGVLCALSLVLMLAALKGTAPKTPAFTPPPFEPAAVVGTPEVPEDLGWEELNVKGLRFSVTGFPKLTETGADVWLTNPADNMIWIKLRFLDKEGNILGETGLLRPGEYVRSVSFEPVLAPGDPVVMKLMAYEPETYHSAGAVNLNVTVKGETT